MEDKSYYSLMTKPETYGLVGLPIRAWNALGGAFAVATALRHPAIPAAPTLTVNSQTQITAVGIAPDDGGATITGYDWRHKKLTADAGWTDRLDETNLTQVFTGLGCRHRVRIPVPSHQLSRAIATTRLPPPQPQMHQLLRN